MDGVSCKIVYHWFRKWSKARVFEHAFYNLVQAYSNVSKFDTEWHLSNLETV
jgi:hypothetical protein